MSGLDLGLRMHRRHPGGGGVALAALALSQTNFATGVPASGTVSGATLGSLISSADLPAGLTIDSASRTWSWDGTGSIAVGSFTLTETLSAAVRHNPIEHTIMPPARRSIFVGGKGSMGVNSDNRSLTIGHGLGFQQSRTPWGGGHDRTDALEALLAGKTVHTLEEFGGAGDGVTLNDTAMTALLAAADSNCAIHLGDGIYCLSASYAYPLNKSNVLFYGNGPNRTILKMLAADEVAIRFPNVTNLDVRDFTLWAPNATQRLNTSSHYHGVYFSGCTNYRIHNVRVKGVPSIGIYHGGASANGTQTFCLSLDSWADANHIQSSGAGNIRQQYNGASGAGDDCFPAIGAVGAIQTNIMICDNYGSDNPVGGRCVAIEGVNGGSVYRNIGFRTASSLVIVNCPTAFGVGDNDNIDVRWNYGVGCRTKTTGDAATRAAIDVDAENAHSHTITVSCNFIWDPACTVGVSMKGSSATNNTTGNCDSNVLINATGSMTTGVSIGTNATVTPSGNTLNGAATP